MPDGISKMKNLAILNLYGTKLEQIPKDLTSLSSLKKLCIIIEDESSIPEDMNKLKLEELYVFYTKGMKTIPEVIFHIPTLKKLGISCENNLFWYNKDTCVLSQIPETIVQLKELEGLYVDYNNLKELPECLDKLPKLKELSVSANTELGKISKSFKNSSSLETFYINPFEINIPTDTLEAILPSQCKMVTEPYALQQFRLSFLNKFNTFQE